MLAFFSCCEHQQKAPEIEKMWVLVGETDREVISTSVWALYPVSLRGASVRLVDEGAKLIKGRLAVFPQCDAQL